MLRRAFDASVAGSTSSNGDDKRRARRTTAERANNANTANDTAAAINANATSANHCKASDANANYTIVVTAVFTATTIAGPHYNRAPTVHYAFRHNTSAGNARRADCSIIASAIRRCTRAIIQYISGRAAFARRSDTVGS
jgi:hypothetical protein